MKKTLSQILLASILLQSCVAYQRTSASLNKAVNMGTVKIKSTTGKTIRMNKIELSEGVYYGENYWTKKSIMLDSTQISAIYLKDIEKSKKLSVATYILVPVGVLVGVIILIAASDDFLTL